MWAEARSGVAAVVSEIRVPLLTFAPVVLVLIGVAALGPEARLWRLVLDTCAGLALWTGMEYVIHRWFLHLVPRGRIRRFLSGRHVLHHRDPEGHPGLIAGKVSLPTMAAFFATVALTMGLRAAAGLTLGVVLGYLLYEYTHLAIHLGVPSLTPWGRKLRTHHQLHHNGHAGANFAILVPAWDAIWHTRRRPRS